MTHDDLTWEEMAEKSYYGMLGAEIIVTIALMPIIAPLKLQEYGFKRIGKFFAKRWYDE